MHSMRIRGSRRLYVISTDLFLVTFEKNGGSGYFVPRLEAKLKKNGAKSWEKHIKTFLFQMNIPSCEL